MEDPADAWFLIRAGRRVSAAERGLRFFIETFGARDMLFDVIVEGIRGRVGTGRVVGV